MGLPPWCGKGACYGNGLKEDGAIAVVHHSAREVFGHIESVKILVILNSTGYMLTSSGFASFI